MNVLHSGIEGRLCMGIDTGIRGRARLKLIQLYRPWEFERTFTLYQEGKVSSVYVTVRVKKMLEIKIPRLKKDTDYDA